MSTVDRDDGDAFCTQIPTSTFREGLDCEPIARPLHEHDGFRFHAPSPLQIAG